MRIALATSALESSDERLLRLRRWADHFRERGDEVVLVWVSDRRPPEAAAARWPLLHWVDAGHDGGREPWGGGWEIHSSRRLEAYLSYQDYDVAFLPADGGLAFVPLQAQRTGASFQRTAIVVVADELCLQARRRTGDLASQPWWELRLDWAERRALALARKVVLGNAEVERWLFENDCRGDAESVRVEEFDWPAFVESEIARRSRPESSPPLVSVCVAHRNQPQYLPQSLASLAENRYSNFEVVVVDDGSDLPEVEAVWEAERARYPRWRFERIAWSGPGAARNAAVRLARGEVLIFFDSDNVAQPHLLEALAGALFGSDLDVVNCYYSGFGVSGSLYPINDFYPLGPALPLALLGNHCGDTVMAIRRPVFESLGGFPESKAVDYEDWAFWARVIASGVRWEVLPRALYWYRFMPHSRCHQVKVGFGIEPILSVFEKSLGKEAIRLARDVAIPFGYRNSEVETELAKLHGEAAEARSQCLRLTSEYESTVRRADAFATELNRPCHVAAHQLGEWLARVPTLRKTLLVSFRTAHRIYRGLMPPRGEGVS